jgi:hypothetical protein
VNAGFQKVNQILSKEENGITLHREKTLQEKLHCAEEEGGHCGGFKRIALPGEDLI